MNDKKTCSDALNSWLELYTWVQPNGTIDYSHPRCRPPGLPIDDREVEDHAQNMNQAAEELKQAR